MLLLRPLKHTRTGIVTTSCMAPGSTQQAYNFMHTPPQTVHLAPKAVLQDGRFRGLAYHEPLHPAIEVPLFINRSEENHWSTGQRQLRSLPILQDRRIPAAGLAGQSNTYRQAQPVSILNLRSKREFQDSDGSMLVQHGIVLGAAHVLRAGGTARHRSAVAAPDQLQRPPQQLWKQRPRLQPALKFKQPTLVI